MSHFPLSIDLTDQTVFLVGNGPQIQQKAEKLEAFRPRLIRKDTFTEADAQQFPAMVIVGDTDLAAAERIAALCRRYRIPVNVVDIPQLCSFYFPALITRGPLTVSVSTGGTSPAAAAYLRQRLADLLPEETEEILHWLGAHKGEFRQKRLLKPATAAAFDKGRPLTAEELAAMEGTAE